MAENKLSIDLGELGTHELNEANTARAKLMAREAGISVEEWIEKALLNGFSRQLLDY